MGGQGSGRKPDVVKRMMEQQKRPVGSFQGEGIYLPNVAWVKDTDNTLKEFKQGFILDAPTQSTHIANKTYVDSQISGENHWDMSADMSNIYPHVDGIAKSV